MQKNIQMSIIAALIVGIGMVMIESALIPAAYAHKHHHSATIKIHQSISQLSSCDNNHCSNLGSNSVTIGRSSQPPGCSPLDPRGC